MEKVYPILVKLKFLIQYGSFLEPELQAQYHYLKRTLNYII